MSSDFLVCQRFFFNWEGLNWEASPHATGGNWSAVAMSSNGQIVTVVGFDGQACFSNDYGESFNVGSCTIVEGQEFVAVDMSYDGVYQYAITSNGTLLFVNATSNLHKVRYRCVCLCGDLHFFESCVDWIFGLAFHS